MAFQVNKISNSGISIVDTSEFLSQSILTTTGKTRYTFDESYTVFIIEKVDKEELTTIIGNDIVKHEYKDNIPLPIKATFCNMQDGLHMITLISIPNKEWLEANDKYVSLYYKNIYYSDGEFIYDKDDNTVSVDLLILCDSNLVQCSKYIFSLDNLEQTVKDLSKLALLDKKITVSRDVAWVGLDVIKYCLRRGHYFLALSRLDR